MSTEGLSELEHKVLVYLSEEEALRVTIERAPHIARDFETTPPQLAAAVNRLVTFTGGAHVYRITDPGRQALRPRPAKRWWQFWR